MEAKRGTRNGILSLAIKDKAVLYAAYMPFIRNGGLFIPTKKEYELGDKVFMLLNLMDEAEKIPVAGKVVGPSFAADEVADVIEAVLDTYRRERVTVKTQAETFIATLRRVGAEPFKLAANAARVSTRKAAHTPETEAV